VRLLRDFVPGNDRMGLCGLQMTKKTNNERDRSVVMAGKGNIPGKEVELPWLMAVVSLRAKGKIISDKFIKGV